MDPNATIDNLNDFLDDTASPESRDIREQVEALAEWLGRGGFAPDWARATPNTAWLLRRAGIMPG